MVTLLCTLVFIATTTTTYLLLRSSRVLSTDRLFAPSSRSQPFSATTLYLFDHLLGCHRRTAFVKPLSRSHPFSATTVSRLQYFSDHLRRYRQTPRSVYVRTQVPGRDGLPLKSFRKAQEAYHLMAKAILPSFLHVCVSYTV